MANDTTDRELLELAAKAAGLWDAENNCVDIPWLPLVNDGDAFRLAVKLGLDVFVRPAQWSECGRIGREGCREAHKGDPCAATRRAIVRAAAAIGKDQHA